VQVAGIGLASPGFFNFDIIRIDGCAESCYFVKRQQQTNRHYHKKALSKQGTH